MFPPERVLRWRDGHQPRCPVCNGPVSLEDSKTDEHGLATHEECYVKRICEKRPSQADALLSRKTENSA